MFKFGKNKSKSSSRTAPWQPQQQYLKQGFAAARDEFAQGPRQYGMGRVAGFGQDTQQAFGALRDYAGPNAMRSASRGLTQDTLEGKYLDPRTNPAYGAMRQNITEGYYGSVNALGSTAESSGRSGSGAHAFGQGQADLGLSRGLSEFEGGLYQFERGQQGQAQSMALAQGQEQMGIINAMREMGGQQDQMAQAQLSDLVSRFQHQQSIGAQEIAEFMGLIGGPVMASRGSQKGSGFNVGIG